MLLELSFDTFASTHFGSLDWLRIFLRLDCSYVKILDSFEYWHYIKCWFQCFMNQIGLILPDWPENGDNSQEHLKSGYNEYESKPEP